MAKMLSKKKPVNIKTNDQDQFLPSFRRFPYQFVNCHNKIKTLLFHLLPPFNNTRRSLNNNSSNDGENSPSMSYYDLLCVFPDDDKEDDEDEADGDGDEQDQEGGHHSFLM